MIKRKTHEEILKILISKMTLLKKQQPRKAKRTSGERPVKCYACHCNTEGVFPNTACATLFIIVDIRQIGGNCPHRTCCLSTDSKPLAESLPV